MRSLPPSARFFVGGIIGVAGVVLATHLPTTLPHLPLFIAKIYFELQQFLAPLYLFGTQNLADADLNLFKIIY